MRDRKLRTRPPLTSRVWFFPALIFSMPLVSRVGMNLLSPQPELHRLGKTDEELCIEEYNQCVEEHCGTDTSWTGYEQCIATCYEQFEQCLEQGPDPYEGPTCDPEAGYCSYDDYDYDYGYDSSGDDSDWTCESSDDANDYESTDWSCSSDDDYSSDDGGWDCSSDNAEGDDGDWGEDWDARSPGGGGGIDVPPDLPG